MRSKQLNLFFSTINWTKFHLLFSTHDHRCKVDIFFAPPDQWSQIWHTKKTLQTSVGQVRCQWSRTPSEAGGDKCSWMWGGNISFIENYKISFKMLMKKMHCTRMHACIRNKVSAVKGYLGLLAGVLSSRFMGGVFIGFICLKGLKKVDKHAYHLESWWHWLDESSEHMKYVSSLSWVNLVNFDNLCLCFFCNGSWLFETFSKFVYFEEKKF